VLAIGLELHGVERWMLAPDQVGHPLHGIG
jgi:hypothetical protein